MSIPDHNSLLKWYKQLYEFKPDKETPESELRWSIAFWLASMNENFKTAAHLILDLSWSNDAHLPSLRLLSGSICSAFNENPSLKEEAFIDLFKVFYE